MENWPERITLNREPSIELEGRIGYSSLVRHLETFGYSVDPAEADQTPKLPPTNKSDFADFAELNGYSAALANLVWSKLFTHFTKGQRQLRKGEIDLAEHSHSYAPVRFFVNPDITSSPEDRILLDTESLSETITWMAEKALSKRDTPILGLGKNANIFLIQFNKINILPQMQEQSE